MVRPKGNEKITACKGGL